VPVPIDTPLGPRTVKLCRRSVVLLDRAGNAIGKINLKQTKPLFRRSSPGVGGNVLHSSPIL